MSVQSREARVFAALLVSVTIGAIVLMALGNRPPSVGAFCLSSYNRLDPVEQAIHFRIPLSPERWNSIKVFCADAAGPRTNRAASPAGPHGTWADSSHFVICNGRLGADGQIQPTDKWRRQLSITDSTGRSGRRTIYVCVLTDGQAALPTDYQVKRAEALAEELLRVFAIRPELVTYPRNWQ